MEMTRREEQIIHMIQNYISDMEMDIRDTFYDDGFLEGEKEGFSEGHEEGYAEGQRDTWDEARNQGFDEGFEECKERSSELIDEAYNAGWNAAVEEVLGNYIDTIGFVDTPTTTSDLQNLTKTFQDNGALVQGLTINYLNYVIGKLKK